MSSLRSGLKFHNGDPCTAEDAVQLARYKGSGAKEFQAKVKSVEVVDARTVRPFARTLAGFHDVLWQQRDRRWPGGAQEISGAGLGEGFKKHPLAWDV